ncbi:hypothetical protein OF83DRAFT_1051434 [Amylostereum chailletii]|nr:hypothetical protein OF83DRAFT_1051434 [Amylostereum chailletii]
MQSRAASDAGQGDQNGQNAFNTERPLNVRPAPEGEGVARDGKEGLPMGKATFMDKMVGKTEKVIGKVVRNPNMHETGELRETGGKTAARGDARASHD